MQYILTFNENQLSIIDKALSQMPYYMAAPVINEINKQIEQSQKVKDEKE